MSTRRPAASRLVATVFVPVSLVTGLALLFGGLASLSGCTDDDPYVPVNNVPIARASGDSIIAVGDPAALNANDSRDFDGDALNYSWSVIDAPQGSFAAFERPGARAVTFVPDVLGAYTLEVSVSDGSDASADTLSLRSVACKIDPEVLSFGPVPMDGAPVSRSFWIYNRGFTSLSGAFSENCPSFALNPAVGSFGIAAGDSLQFTVELQPVAGGAPNGLRCEISTGLADCPTVTAIALPSTEDGGSIGFADVHAALRSISCLGCHPSDLSSDLDASYAWISPLVNVSNPQSSEILTYPTASGHSGSSTVLSEGRYDPGDPVYDLVLDWIRQGAPR